MTESEAATRRKRIDPRLRSSGWSVHSRPDLRWGPNVAIVEWPTTAGPADYALLRIVRPSASSRPRSSPSARRAS